MTTERILNQLNDYTGDNIWQDVIYDLDVDEDATDEIDEGRNDRFVLDGGRTFVHDAQRGEWTSE